MANIRVTVILPPETVEEMDRIEPDRSRFILEAIRRELARRRREELTRSLREPHSESPVVAGQGLVAWARNLPEDAAGDLVDLRGGTPVRWTPGEGRTERIE